MVFSFYDSYREFLHMGKDWHRLWVEADDRIQKHYVIRLYSQVSDFGQIGRFSIYDGKMYHFESKYSVFTIVIVKNFP